MAVGRETLLQIAQLPASSEARFNEPLPLQLFSPSLFTQRRRFRIPFVKTSSVVTTRYALRHAPMGFPAEARTQTDTAIVSIAAAGTTSPFIESSAATYSRPRRRNAAGGRLVVAMCTLATAVSAYAAFSFVS